MQPKKLSRILWRLRLGDLVGLDAPEVEEPKRPGPGLDESEVTDDEE